MEHGKSCRGKLGQSRCDASGYSDMCGHLLDAVSKPESDALGDEVSITLGTDLHRLRTFYLIVASVMIGFAVYCAGVIGFVGLVIPHVVRILFGTDHRRLLPLSALLGASFLIWCDVACRVILKNSEMPIGVLVSIIGAPCFIYLLVRKSYGFGGAR